ncbi:MAG: AAA family ATPase [Terracidiphilus sp.]
MDSPVTLNLNNHYPSRSPIGGNGHAHALSIAVVDPILERRNSVVSVLCGMRTNSLIPKVTNLQEVANSGLLLSQGFDVVLLAVDGDPEAALKTIEALSRSGIVTPMAYSQHSNDDLLIRCMRAGVREFLIFPFAAGVIEEAIGRTQSRGQLTPDTKKVSGKSFVFLGAKGGSGVTTAACNFAISMAQESRRSTLLIDMDLPLGDAALTLGLTSEFSTVDALRDPERIDSMFLHQLSTQHSSGLYVLGAPGKFLRTHITTEAIDKLISVASKTFEYVVVDAGSRWDLVGTRVFDFVSTIYLVTQVSIAELRNSNRLITGCLQGYSPKLEIVLNRYKSEMFGIGAEEIEDALTRPADWRIPNDYPAVREMQNTAVPLALKQSGIQKAILVMARIASGLPAEQQKKRFSLFGTT